MLDTLQNLIVINGCIRTTQIESYQYEAPNKCYIVFASNPKEYAYWVDKVLWLKNPETPDPTIYRLPHNVRQLTNIATTFKFRDMCKPVNIRLFVNVDAFLPIKFSRCTS